MRTDGIEPPMVNTNGFTAQLPNQMRIILKEIKIDIHYYFPAAGSPTTTLFRLNRNQRHTLKLLP
jgi:hypothetical protein